MWPLICLLLVHLVKLFCIFSASHLKKTSNSDLLFSESINNRKQLFLIFFCFSDWDGFRHPNYFLLSNQRRDICQSPSIEICPEKTTSKIETIQIWWMVSATPNGRWVESCVQPKHLGFWQTTAWKWLFLIKYLLSVVNSHSVYST